jgi:broad specificity phosphatase PhoE
MADDRTVTLLRHGETEWSASHKHTGRTDIELTPAGEDHARRAGEALRGASFAAVLCSPLRRAVDTCRLAGLGEPELLDDLQEWDYGEAEGRTTPEMAEDVPGWTVWTHPLERGELVDAVGERADRVVARLDAVDGDAVVVAHGHLLRILTARWLGLDAVEGRRFVLGTAAICRLGYEHGNRVIEHWNDTGHMR